MATGNRVIRALTPASTGGPYAMYFEGLAQLESGGEQLLGRVLSLAGQQRRELRR